MLLMLEKQLNTTNQLAINHLFYVNNALMRAPKVVFSYYLKLQQKVKDLTDKIFILRLIDLLIY